MINDYNFPGGNELSPKAGKLINNLLHNVNGPYAQQGSGFRVTYMENILPDRVKTAIDTAFAEADEDDVSLFYIACHGNTTSTDAEAGKLILTNGSKNENLLLGTLADWLAAVPGKVFVILEACGSGAGIYVEETSPNAMSAMNRQVIDAFQAVDRPLSAKTEEYCFDENGERASSRRAARTGELRQEKFCVLTAASYQQESYDYQFDQLFVNGVGLTGAMPADLEGNGDGVVTLNELHRYIQRWGDRLPYARNKEIYITQQVQAYPENSDYPLFTR